MSASPIVIPYEKQVDPQTNRGCGAACLSMVYRSLGKEVPQAEIWPAIAKKNRFGSVASTSHLMALDAAKRGFAAVAIQARHSLQVLRLCRGAGVRAILNHRAGKDSASGHYSVFVDMDDKVVVLHDPFYGPSRSLPHEELLELWRPRTTESEIIGFGLIAIADPNAPSVSACEFCHSPMPLKVGCPRCKQPVGLRPSVPLGCINNACIARMWNYVSCPSCDYTWNFSVDASAVTSAPPPDPAAEKADKPEPLSMAAAFAEMSKFCDQILAIPAAAQNPDIRKQIDALAAVKDQLVLSRAEALFHLKVQEDRMAAMKESAKAGEDAHRQKMDAANQPAPRLDGGALAAALMKNLGFK
jgi:predicted double-glycine peptidase